MDNQDRWRVVEGFPDYEVSDSGSVRRLGGFVTRSDEQVRPVPDRVLSPHNGGTNGRYHRVTLWNHGMSKVVYVHRIVMATFVGPCPPKHEVNHIDGDPTNNGLANLEYVNSAQNKQHGVFVRRGLIAGTNHWGQKLQEIDVSAIRYLAKGGYTQLYLARRFGVSPGTIEKIVLGKVWRHSSLLPSAVAAPREETT